MRVAWHNHNALLLSPSYRCSGTILSSTLQVHTWMACCIATKFTCCFIALWYEGIEVGNKICGLKWRWVSLFPADVDNLNDLPHMACHCQKCLPILVPIEALWWWWWPWLCWRYRWWKWSPHLMFGNNYLGMIGWYWYWRMHCNIRLCSTVTSDCFVTDCHNHEAFLAHGLLTSIEWSSPPCTMGGCAIYNFHTCLLHIHKGGGSWGWSCSLMGNSSYTYVGGVEFWGGEVGYEGVQPWKGGGVICPHPPLPYICPSQPPIRLCLFISRSTHLISSDSNELSFPSTILCK